MSNIVIKVENVSKQYRLGKIGTGSFKHDLNRWWHTMRGKEDPYLKIGEENDRTKKGTSEYVWALRDVSFDVRQGEVLGIIGRNGAGKSTMLKLLSRTTIPTIGSIKVKGRIASLLEVGTGFHPELSGRENIFLNGAILGMTKDEIKNKLDEIIDFSGVEKYIDTPVKRYSSGMYVRLAFAVAAHLEPEILIIDEVLAVGDAEFQKKCLGKINDVANKDGRTVIFVSHNMSAISTLTNRCIFLNHGGLKFDGNTTEVIQNYLDFLIERSTLSNNNNIDYFRRSTFKDSPVFMRSIVVNNTGADVAQVKMHEAITIKIELEVVTQLNGANVTIVLKNSRAERVAILFSWDHNVSLHLEKGRHYLHVSFQNNLAPGNYYVDVGINQSTATVAYDIINDYFICTVINDGQVIHWEGRPWGFIHYSDIKWNFTKTR